MLPTNRRTATLYLQSIRARERRRIHWREGWNADELIVGGFSPSVRQNSTNLGRIRPAGPSGTRRSWTDVPPPPPPSPSRSLRPPAPRAEGGALRRPEWGLTERPDCPTVI